MKKSTTLLFYLLSVYVIVQFVWWGFYINQLNHQVNSHDVAVKKTMMIIGEGTVFLLILILGIIRIQKNIKRDLIFSRNQNNFLLSVTHELKTPLASNKLYLQTLQKHQLSVQKQQEIIEKALDQNSQLEQLINNILNASRLENRRLLLHIDDVNVSKYLTQITDRFSKQHHSIVFKTRIQEDVQYNIDPFIIETVLNNLIENAIKYTGDDAVIEIEMTVSEHLHISVIDNGIGVPLDQRRKIFKKFYRLGNEETRTQKGSGLGLFIVYEFLHLHNGYIRYKVNKPKGSIFEIII